jgi:hypothetical protein
MDLRDVEDGHGLEKWLSDSGEVVSVTHLQRSSPRKQFYLYLCYSFLLEAE